MFVGETGVLRIVERTAEVMRDNPDADVRQLGVIDLDTIQRYVNFWYSISLDLFGGDISSNAASYFASGIKGRAYEERYDDHVALAESYAMQVPEGDRLVDRNVPLRNAMNAVLRDAYVEDSQRGVDKFNKALKERGIERELVLPSARFHRKVGIYAGIHATPAGEIIEKEEFERRRDEWLPSESDQRFVKSLMSRAVTEPGQMANFIAPPRRGIKGRPIDFNYVRLD